MYIVKRMFDDVNELAIRSRTCKSGSGAYKLSQLNRHSNYWNIVKPSCLIHYTYTEAKMAAAIGLAITNVVVGLGNIGAGIGFTVAEQNKMDELGANSKKL